MGGGGGLLPGLAGEHGPAAGGVGQGLARAWCRSWGAPGLAAGRCGVAGVAAAVGLDAELVGQGGQDAGLVFGLGGDQGRGCGRAAGTAPTTARMRCPARTGTGRGRASRGRGLRPGARSRAGRPARPRPAAGRPVPSGRRRPASTTPVLARGSNRRGPGRSGWSRRGWVSAAACSPTTRPRAAAWPVSSASCLLTAAWWSAWRVSSRVICSAWAASWSAMAVIGSLRWSWSAPGEGGAVAAEPFGGHVVRQARLWLLTRGQEARRWRSRGPGRGGGRGGRRGSSRRGAAGR